MDLQKSFGVDKEAAENGRWFRLEDGGSVRVARMTSPAYRAEIVRLSKPHLAILNSSMDTTELLDEITIAAMSRKILLDWKDINLDGKAIVYSSDKALEIMTLFPDFREVVSALSVERRNFVPKDVAEK